ncbi:MAG: polysaccharide deacetylase family protein [Flammeovirgaceae bacterium]
MLIHKMGWIFQKLLYPQLTWSRYSDEKVIYLTFDDGPVPDVTEWVLSQLFRYQAKATFFCVGDNIRKYPQIFENILKNGHNIGNHTFNHLNGWKTEKEKYFENIFECQAVISKHCKETKNSKPLFRPPYGRIKKEQIKGLLPQYEIIMWDVLSGDYRKDISAETCLKKSVKHTENGSIVVFHDSYKAVKNLHYVLPRYLEHFLEKGYSFEGLLK